jgi:hypothetical protein
MHFGVVSQSNLTRLTARIAANSLARSDIVLIICGLLVCFFFECKLRYFVALPAHSIFARDIYDFLQPSNPLVGLRNEIIIKRNGIYRSFISQL